MSKNLVTMLVLLGIAVLAARVLFPPPDQHQSTKMIDGGPAPDFSAVAIDGQMIRLSELRGKVVVLDFWATWCGPCMALIPHEREMVIRFQGQPFAFIGISGDDDLNKLKRVVAAERITWPNIFEGSKRPIARKYGIQYLPTIFVLDAAGIIRYKDVRGAELEDAVASLLKEMH